MYAWACMLHNNMNQLMALCCTCSQARAALNTTGLSPGTPWQAEDLWPCCCCCFCRGMGEKQIEVDKRLLRNQIASLERAIEDVRRHRAGHRRRRNEVRCPALERLFAARHGPPCMHESCHELTGRFPGRCQDLAGFCC